MCHIWKKLIYGKGVVGRRRRKRWRKWGNFQENISRKLLGRFLSNLVCTVAYMEGIKCVNLIEISPVVIEIQRVENGELVVSVNNVTCVMYWPSLVLWLSHACTHAVNIPLYGMLCDYIIAALQAMISVIIVIGIRVRLRKTITHVTLVSEVGSPVTSVVWIYWQGVFYPESWQTEFGSLQEE